MRVNTSRHLLGLVLTAGGYQGLFGQMLYVANNGEGTISSFFYDQVNGGLTEIRPRVATPGSPTSVAIHPNGKFAFVTTTNGPTLTSHSIDPATGKLTRVSVSTFATGSIPQQVAIDATGKFAVVAHPGAPNLSILSIDASTGATTPVAGSPFTTPAQPTSVVIHPNGFVYVAVNGTSQIVALNLATPGTAIAGSPFAGKSGVQGMAMDPAGKFLYVVERQDPGVLAYSINATTGALTPVPGSPFAMPNTFLTGLAVDPAGKFVYVSNGGGVIHRFAIGANGALTPQISTPAPFGASSVILEPKGRFLYVPCGTTVPTLTTFNSVASFSVDASTGALTRIGDLTPVGENTSPLRGAAVLLDPPIVPAITVDSITNFYSHVPQGMPNSSIAQGSRMALYGSNIGPANEVLPDFPLETALGGVSVQIKSGDVTTKALMFYVSSGSVNCVVPSATPLGDATVTLTYNGRTTAPVPVTIVKTSVGIRSWSDRDIRGGGSGYGPSGVFNVPADIALRLDPSIAQVWVPNSLNQPAKPGQVAFVQATGLGAVTADETSQQILLEVDTPAEVIVGNKTVPAILKARASYGQDFIAFKLPDDVPQGCYVPIAVRAGGYTSNVGSFSVSANGGSCSDPHGLSASDVDTAVKSGGFNIGVIELDHLGFGDEAGGRFVRYDAEALLSSFAAASAAGIRGVFALPPLGSCTVTPGNATIGVFDVPGDKTPAQRLNAGQVLNLSGPNVRQQLAAPQYGFSVDGSDLFTPGDYTVDNGTGTQTVGSFKGAITLPPPLKWTNSEALSAPNRGQDLTVTWTGGVADKEFVMIAGLAQNEKVTAAFLCTERVAAGRFTVPAWVLSNLPASADVVDGGQRLPGGLLIVATSPLTSVGRFTATGLDFGLFTYEQGSFNFASFR